MPYPPTASHPTDPPTGSEHNAGNTSDPDSRPLSTIYRPGRTPQWTPVDNRRRIEDPSSFDLNKADPDQEEGEDHMTDENDSHQEGNYYQTSDRSSPSTNTDNGQANDTIPTTSSLPVATGWGDYEDAAASWLSPDNVKRVKSFLLSNPPGNADAYPRGTKRSSDQKQWRRNAITAISTTLRTSGVSSDKTCTQNGGAYEKANWPTLIFLSNLQEYASEPHRLAERMNSDFDPVITADNHARAKAKVVFLPADR